MDLSQSPADKAFRQTIRTFVETEYPQSILEKVGRQCVLDKADLVASEQALSRKGWLAAGWPVEYGGPGWSVRQRLIFDEELERAGVPNVVPMGLLYVGPIIYTFGTPEQKARWLGDIRNARAFWAQGYSEPEAGSDLASLNTRAVRDGKDYVVTGEKIWTGQAHYADWIFCLVRTSDEARKQAGISFLCIDMQSAGIEVRPILGLDGDHYLNRVFFNGVRVPVENRIGEEGRGWSYARQLLDHERASYAHVATKRRDLARIRTLSASAPWGDVFQDPFQGFVRRVAEAEMALDALEITVARALAPLAEGTAPGNESSTLKIAATELAQQITELFLEMAALYAAPTLDRSTPDWHESFAQIPRFAAPAMASYLKERAQSIYGGTNEVQRNIIARRLGL